MPSGTPPVQAECAQTAGARHAASMMVSRVAHWVYSAYASVYSACASVYSAYASVYSACAWMQCPLSTQEWQLLLCPSSSRDPPYPRRQKRDPVCDLVWAWRLRRSEVCQPWGLLCDVCQRAVSLLCARICGNRPCFLPSNTRMRQPRRWGWGLS